jgi:repressor LexA
MTERFTAKQGQYSAYNDNYSVMFGQAAAEADLQRFFGISQPTIHEMLVTLAEKG